MIFTSTTCKRINIHKNNNHYYYDYTKIKTTTTTTTNYNNNNHWMKRKLFVVVDDPTTTSNKQQQQQQQQQHRCLQITTSAARTRTTRTTTFLTTAVTRKKWIIPNNNDITSNSYNNYNNYQKKNLQKHVRSFCSTSSSNSNNKKDHHAVDNSTTTTNCPPPPSSITIQEFSLSSVYKVKQHPAILDDDNHNRKDDDDDDTTKKDHNDNNNNHDKKYSSKNDNGIITYYYSTIENSSSFSSPETNHNNNSQTRFGTKTTTTPDSSSEKWQTIIQQPLIHRTTNNTSTTNTTVEKKNHSQPFLSFSSLTIIINSLFEKYKNQIIHQFLPAHYPKSVAPGYSTYSLYNFLGSIAGSASMVLATQTLLIAFVTSGSGSVGQQVEIPSVPDDLVSSSSSSEGMDAEGTMSSTGKEQIDKNAVPSSSSSSTTTTTVGTVATAGIVAGAFNWILKDGVGQLGGIYFASYMGQYKQFDLNPKLWKLLSTITLDVASLLEITSVMIVPHTSFLLPLACITTILKNIGYLTASASKAAIHQTLITTKTTNNNNNINNTTTKTTAVTMSNNNNNHTNNINNTDTTVSFLQQQQPQQQQEQQPRYVTGSNLADVTAKAGSQAMAAGLIGTGVGITLSSFLQHMMTTAFHDVPTTTTYLYLPSFVVLSILYQTCTYLSLRAIALRHFNSNRLHIVLNHYLLLLQQQQQQNTPMTTKLQQQQYHNHFKDGTNSSSSSSSRKNDNQNTNYQMDDRNLFYKDDVNHDPTKVVQVPSSNKNVVGGFVLSPEDVANMENFIPLKETVRSLLWNNNSNNKRNTIKSMNDYQLLGDNECYDATTTTTTTVVEMGTSLLETCPNGYKELKQIQNILHPNTKYTINIIVPINLTAPNTNAIKNQQQQQQPYHTTTGTNHRESRKRRRIVRITFMDTATGEDLIMGTLHSLLVQQYYRTTPPPTASSTTTEDILTILKDTFQSTNILFPKLLFELHQMGWNTNTDVTMIEPTHSKRYKIIEQK